MNTSNKWTMRDGTEIEISSMTTLHIKNTVEMLTRRMEFLKLNKELITDMSNVLNIFKKAAKAPIPSYDYAKTNVDEADGAINSALEKNHNWIQTFNAELYRRETN